MLLLLQTASDGHIEISTSASGLESLIAEVAQTEAAKHGVTIDGVELILRSKSPGRWRLRFVCARKSYF